MFNSKWFTEYEETLKQAKEQGQKNKKVIPVILTVIFAGMILMFMNSVPAQNRGSALVPLVTIYVVLMVLVVVLSKKSAKSDDARYVRETLEKYLTTDELAQEFDREMMSAPAAVLEAGPACKLMFTEHYLYKETVFGGVKNYSFVRLSDIKSNNYATAKSATSASPLQRDYIIDLLDASGKKVFGVTVEGTKKTEMFYELLTKACPGIVLKAL